jgi:hypothetical protein
LQGQGQSWRYGSSSITSSQPQQILQGQTQQVQQRISQQQVKVNFGSNPNIASGKAIQQVQGAYNIQGAPNIQNQIRINTTPSPIPAGYQPLYR